ncbi:hypothetical protein PH5382_01742 [Phaeobacter sp. CECT 5382]|nr:hypothetical protein PH5382_01742 [Phaeobacter sp. CECT 5382]
MALLGCLALLSACAGTKAVVSQTPLLWDYPLMPGVTALWERLAKAAQRRALTYLADGSTIRSSLNGEWSPC